jgi:hypothetical protein
MICMIDTITQCFNTFSLPLRLRQNKLERLFGTTHNDKQHISKNATQLSGTLFCHYTKCHKQAHYVECRSSPCLWQVFPGQIFASKAGP